MPETPDCELLCGHRSCSRTCVARLFSKLLAGEAVDMSCRECGMRAPFIRIILVLMLRFGKRLVYGIYSTLDGRSMPISQAIPMVSGGAVRAGECTFMADGRTIKPDSMLGVLERPGEPDIVITAVARGCSRALFKRAMRASVAV